MVAPNGEKPGYMGFGLERAVECWLHGLYGLGRIWAIGAIGYRGYMGYMLVSGFG